MAVESTRYINMNPYHNNNFANNNNNGCVFPPLSGTTTESFVPFYGTAFVQNGSAKADSGLTYANTRKRPREIVVNNPMMMSYLNGGGERCGNGLVTFLGDDLTMQIQQEQFEMDRLIAQHTEKVRREIEERRKRYSRRIIASIGLDIAKRLKAKDEQIENIVKVNWTLQEKIKTLSVESQIWHDLAQTNEATAQVLRNNLEQALIAQQFKCDDVGLVGDDAGSFCGSNDRVEAGEECGTSGVEKKSDGICRHCGVGISSVLLLPCRHLCLCSVCGSSVYTCPVCKTPKNASVHVIM